MKNWKTVKLGDILNNRQTEPDSLQIADGETPIISKISFNEGKIELRNDGISNTKLICCFPNDLIISGINASKGAIAINKFDKNIAATIHYSAYSHNDKKVDLSFLLYYFRSQKFQNFLSFELAQGLKTELKPKKFLSIEIPLPPLAEQQRIVARLSELKNKIDEVKILRGEQEKDSKNLLYSLFLNTIKKANWLKMGDIAPIIRREITISEEGSYPELGIRSFGKGTFHKPPLKGFDVGTKRLFQIKERDLIFSNVFAWEGAIAVVKKEDNDRFGSHRFISCNCDKTIVLPEFICFYFLTEKGLEKINEASPGGAGRNKTLGLTKLENTLVPVPTLEAQQKFLRIQAQLNATKQYQTEQMTLLNGIFPSLLNKAFRGEL